MKASIIRTGIFFFAWTLPVFSHPSGEFAQSTDIAFFTQFAKQLRSIPRQAFGNEEARAFHLLSDNLPDYGEVEELETALTALLDDALPSTTDLDIINSKKTAFHGKSNAEVFFILDRTGQMQYVVKAFRNPESSPAGLVAELSSMAAIKERKLSSVASAIPIAVGKCRNKERSYGLLLQSAASGKRLDQYIGDVAAHRQEDPERLESLLKARQAFLRVGASLAEFNGLDLEQRSRLARSGYLRIKVEFERLFTPEVKARVNGKFDVRVFKKWLNRKLRKIFHQHSGKFYQHGDAGLCNIFYDLESDKITLIDVARIHQKITHAGKPLSPLPFDFFHLWRKLQNEVKADLNQEEQETILEAFYLGYVDAEKHEGGDRQNLYDTLSKLIRLCNCDEIPDHVERKKQRALFQHYCNYIKNLK